MKKTSQFIMFCILAVMIGCTPEPKFELIEGDRIAIIGNALADRMQHDGWLETYLQASHPGDELVIRNLGFSGDQIHHRPRSCGNRTDRPEGGYECIDHNFWHPDSLLTNVTQSNVIFSFFGYNESFDDDPEHFRKLLTEWIENTRQQRYDGENTPRIILFSPISHEDLGSLNLPDGTENNRRLAEYTRVMDEVAGQKEVTFVDLYKLSQNLYRQSDDPLTINGVHLTEEGNRQIARIITEDLFGLLPGIEKEQLELLREAVLDKNWHWFNRYRATSGNDVWGSRAVLHGNRETLQHELTMLDVMTTNRDRRIWVRANGEELEIDDSNVPDPLPVESNFLETRHASGHAEDGNVVFWGGVEAIEKMSLADGLSVNLFASEESFPELVNPVQMQVDPQGRIWVSAWATYPKWEPLKEMNDQLIILEDTTGDGVADKSTTFANIHNPTGFEFWNGGVIVASAPDVLFLKDTTGDNKADVQIRILSGIDSADTHHTANNIILGPDGFIYYQRGIFHLNNVETPWGRSIESDIPGLYRFNPRTHQFEFVVENVPNSHGISFDKWGYQFITDATSGRAFQVYLDGDTYEKRKLLEHTIRPVPANSIISSSHFPEEFDNNFLIYNTIGFLGIKRYELEYDNGVVWGEEIGDLISSEDPNFRPTDGVIGNDGAFYISDWHNPTVGHMQHNLRDPIRDHEYGRIYRITADDYPLQKPVSIYGEPIENLLDLFKHPIDGIRHRVRVELSSRESSDVIPLAQQWVQQFDSENEDHALPMMEILWLHQQHNVINNELLDQLLSSPVVHARISARRVERDWRQHKPHSAKEYVHELDNPEFVRSSVTDSGLDFTERAVAELAISAVKEEMRFDIIEFTVRSGQNVELLFVNPDYMPHNLLITEPETVDEVYQMAIDLGGRGFEKHFNPDSPKVLHATRLINNEESELLNFTAPSVPGDYPFICTFPGHGDLMRGVMKVID